MPGKRPRPARRVQRAARPRHVRREQADGRRARGRRGGGPGDAQAYAGRGHPGAGVPRSREYRVQVHPAPANLFNPSSAGVPRSYETAPTLGPPFDPGHRPTVGL